MKKEAAIREFIEYKAFALDAARELYRPNVVEAIANAKSILEIQIIQRKARENL